MQLPFFKTLQRELASGPFSSLLIPSLLFSVFIVVALSIGLTRHSSRDFIANPDEQLIPAATFFREFPEDQGSASIVDLGLYLDSVYDFEVNKLTFKARGWLWYRWEKHL
ncbi:MAG: hypothetical protein FJ164_07970 [Gammaproteobacteria bacterium]|nr:hypothetical protein [Gammaproteobacteria bacterium]